MKDNRYYVKKADTELSDIITNGGYLQEEQSKKFIVDMIKESVVLKMVNVTGLKSHSKKLPKVGLEGRVLRPGTSGVALSEAERTRAVTDQVELGTKLFKGEIQLDDETLEDNIEQKTFKETVMAMVREQIALDLDEIAVNGDTNSTDDFLAQFDGMIALATSHLVDAGSATLAKSHLKAAMKNMPSQYNRLASKQMFMTAENVETDYRDYLADRATVLGDKMIEGESPLVYNRRKIMSVPVFPEDLGGSNNESVVLYTHPKNFTVGFWRRVRFQTDYNVPRGVWSLVPTVRVGAQYIEEDAVVKIHSVLAA